MDIKAFAALTGNLLTVTLTSYPDNNTRCRCFHVPRDITREEWQAFTREAELVLFAQKEESKS